MNTISPSVTSPVVAVTNTRAPMTTIPMRVEMDGTEYQFRIWRGEQLPDQLLAYDTETALIEGREVPPLAMAIVHGDAGSCYFIHPDVLPQFVMMHHRVYWVCHNATFDFWVTAQAIEHDPPACAAWWDIAGGGRLLCTMLLDSLIRLGRSDAEPVGRDLGAVAADYCPGLCVDKSDPFRLRYGELIGLPTTAWQDTEPGFWSYAAKDPIATLRVVQRQFAIAQELITPHRETLLPEAIRRFGPLTACLQVQGSIALDFVSRFGIHLDLPRVTDLHDSITALVESHRDELEKLLPGSFKRHGPRSENAGQLQLTPAGVPRRNAKAIKEQLQQIAVDATPALHPPRNKDGLVTDAVTFWEQHRDRHPFIAAYVNYSEQAKLAQFFKALDQPRIYPRYRDLVRTGRTSCSAPNLQQMPRDARFREMIVAPPGYWLLQVDYSVLELRTLAQICLRQCGRSVLAELFHRGDDPHKYTAALFMGLTPEQFAQLPAAEQKQHRQRTKAINFGVPGGLGAESLVSYAKQGYGVELTFEQARDFRRTLITQVYPELDAYLDSNQYADIAGNLHTTQAAVRQALPVRDQILNAGRIIAGEAATLDGDTYHAGLVQHVWQLLQRLNNNPTITNALAAQNPSFTLMCRIFHGDAVTISGRLRGHVGFTQRMNTPFQGLAADGNKLALFRLLRAGYQVCGFVHDEMLVLIPDGVSYTAAVQEVQQIMSDAMRELTPDIPIATEYLLADRWYKDVDEQPLDGEGKIIPYQRNVEGTAAAAG